MKKIEFIICMLIISISCAGCAPGLVSGLVQDVGINLIKEGLKAAGRDKPIFRSKEKEQEPSDKYAKKNFVKPDRVVKIDKESEVYMYYKEGRINLFAFIGDKLYNSGYSESELDKTKSDNQLRDEAINSFPCYAHLRPIPIMEAHSLDLQPKEVATSFGTLKLGRDGDTLEAITKKMGQKPSEQEITHKGNGEADTDSVAVFYKDGNTFVFGLYGGKTVLYAEKTGILSLKDALAAAGITPAAALEPTPAPKPTTRTFGPMPTMGFTP